MPNRLLREGLMESERVLSMPVEARWLFVVIILSADDLGLFEATEFKLARRADVNRDLAGKLMAMLADADLVRFYVVDGKRYGFIPRFRQRIQIKRARHPLPPDSLLTDDQDAFSKIKHLASNPTDGQPCADVGHPSEPEVEVELEVSEEAKASSSSPRATKTPKIPCPYEAIVTAYHDALPELPKVRLLDGKVWEDRKKAMGSLWTWSLTSKRVDGTRRAENSEQALEWLRNYFAQARNNDFLMGRTERSGKHKNWRCDLDFVLTPAGLRQIVEKTEVAA